MRLQLSVKELREMVQPELVCGNFSGNITQIASLQEATEGTLSFLANPKYGRDVAASKASLLLLPENFDFTPRPGQIIFFCANPSIALAKICRHIEKLNENSSPPAIHSTATIHPTAQLGRNVSLGPHVVVEEGVTIGERTIIGAGTFVGRHSSIGCDGKIFPNVSIMAHAQIGDHVILHSGVVIGSDGFGFVKIENHHEKIPQIGSVVIENFVEIGANTTVDRARFASTIIGQGTKIDNLVQIAHNVKIGKNCIIVAQVGIAGSTTIGDDVTIGGQAGITGHLHIADGTQIGAQSGVTKDTQAHSVLLGSPAVPFKEAARRFASLAKLPEILKKISKIISL